MPAPHVHSPSTWTEGILWLSLISLSIGSAIYRHAQRRAKWKEVLTNAHAWAASVGGTLQRVSEQPAVHGYRNSLIARRYRVTFIDPEGAQCVAILRFTCADQNWSLERLTRDSLQDSDEVAAVQNDAEQAAEGYARRHRAKAANVPVIFAPPKRRRPPRRST